MFGNVPPYRGRPQELFDGITAATIVFGHDPDELDRVIDAHFEQRPAGVVDLIPLTGLPRDLGLRQLNPAPWQTDRHRLTTTGPGGRLRLRRPSPPRCRTCPFAPEPCVSVRPCKERSFGDRNKRSQNGPVSWKDSSGI
jgi:hypothetical protein